MEKRPNKFRLDDGTAPTVAPRGRPRIVPEGPSEDGELEEEEGPVASGSSAEGLYLGSMADLGILRSRSAIVSDWLSGWEGEGVIPIELEGVVPPDMLLEGPPEEDEGERL